MTTPQSNKPSSAEKNGPAASQIKEPPLAGKAANKGRRHFLEMVNRIGKPRAPDFFGIGAEKCGTTWLWQMFRDHPQIGVPLPKELRYFSSRHLGTGFNNFNALVDLLDGRTENEALTHIKSGRLARELRIALGGDPAYLRVFGGLNEKAVGDITPQYCALPPEGVDHMKRVAPDARIIMMLRDPVSRTISAGKMKAREKFGALSQENIRTHSLVDFQIRMSRYSVMLDRFEEAFPGKVFVGFIDDIASAPLGLLADLCAFLEVDYSPDYFTRLDVVANEGAKFSVSVDLKRHLYGMLSEEYDLLEARFPERVAGWRAQYEGL